MTILKVYNNKRKIKRFPSTIIDLLPVHMLILIILLFAVCEINILLPAR